VVRAPKQWKVIGTEPTASGWLIGMLPALKQPNPVITAFSPERFVALRDLITGQFPLAEFKEFGDVVGGVLARMNMASKRLPQTSMVEEALATVMHELPEDAWLARSREYAGTYRALAKTLTTLRRWGLAPSDLERLSLKVEDPLLSHKLRELAKVDFDAEALLEQLGLAFNRWRMESVISEESPRIDINLVVLAGSEIQPLEKDWLFWLSQGGSSVTILVDDGAPEGSFPAARFWDPDLKRPDEAANEVSSKLFGANAASDRYLHAEIWAMPDRLAETEWAMRRIAELRDAGEPLSGIAIHSRQMQRYDHLIRIAARMYGIEIRASQRLPLPDCRIASFVIALLNALADSTPRRLIPLVNSSYVGMNQIERESTREILFGVLRADSPWEELAEKELPEWLKQVLEWRKSAVAEPCDLVTWRDRMEALTQADWMLDALTAPGRSYETDSRAVNALVRAVARIATFDRFGEATPRGLRSFLRRAQMAWQTEEIYAPGADSGVQVSQTAAGLGLVDTVFALGLSEGEFPRREREDPVFTDQELLSISAKLPDFRPPLPTSPAIAQEERDEFFRLASAPFVRLILSYPEADEDQVLSPSAFLKEIPVPIHARSRRQRTADPPRTPLDMNLAEALSAPREHPPEFVLTDPQVLLRAGEPNKEAVRIGQLEDASECAFRHFAEWRLNLAPRSTRQAFRGLYSLPGKAKLASAPDPIVARTRLEQALDGMVTDLTGRLPADELRAVSATGHQMVQEWLRREFHARGLWPRNETITDLVGFDYPPFRNTLPGTNVRLTGDLPARSVRNGQGVIHLFLGAKVLDTGEDYERILERYRLRLGLMLFSLPPGEQAIEIDSASGMRTLIFYRGPNTPPWRSNGVEMIRFELDPVRKKEFWRAIEPRIRRGLTVIESGITTPEPSGERCPNCVFGELCRRSTLFSDAVDPFEIGFPVDEEESE
jgi:hypothetical protein